MANLVVFGIDVSSQKSAVCLLVNQQVLKEYELPNNLLGFKQLLADLQTFNPHPEIVFEATSVYSRRLQAFLDQHGYRYVMLNPLKAKQQLAQFRLSKTDRHDAYQLAKSQYLYRRAPTYLQSPIYQQLGSLSRFYAQLTRDLVSAKNRLHRVLQLTFPELEQLLSSPRGLTYWRCVKLFPHPSLVQQAGQPAIVAALCKLKGVGPAKAANLTKRLLNLAALSASAVASTAFENEEAVYYAERLLKLEAQRKQVIAKMAAWAGQLPHRDDLILESIPGISQVTALCLLGELGDLRRFRNPNALNAFVGVDLRHYESGKLVLSDHISKRGDALARKLLYHSIGQIEAASRTQPCRIADYYDKRKRSSQARSFKKIAIAVVHKLLRTVYHLIKFDQTYDYNVVS